MVKLPSLDYAYDSLGGSISKDIMELHHAKHHQTYVDNFNEALGAYPELESRSTDDLLRNLDEVPKDVHQAVRNNGGGHYNHSLFWKWMSPSGGGEPTGELKNQLIEKYGSYQQFVDQFSQQALAIFGSGWAWLQPDMSITTTANQDNPLMDGQAAPILGLDVWEHAYYLDYQNRRPDYVKAWWDVVDWQFVAHLLATN